MGQLSEGIYEKVRTVGLDAELGRLAPGVSPEFTAVDEAEAPDVVARHVAEAVRRLLADVDDPQRRVSLTNELLTLLQAPDEQLPGTTEHLIALAGQLTPSRALVRPVTPLSQAALLTNAQDEPSLSTELRAELASADRVDLLCAFIRWHGLRVLEEQLTALRDRDVPFRVLTTTYVGATG